MYKAVGNAWKYAILLTFVFQACAVIRAPEGGQPDTTGPAVASYSPAQRTVNFTGESVKIEFSEYVNMASVMQNIFISPPVAIEPNWSGREFEIIFTDKLAANTSYAVTFGTEYTDLHNNKPEEAFSLIFSTGPTVDSGIIRGQVLSPNPEGTFIFLYPLAGINADTLNPLHTKPKYKTQVGSSGKFEFIALADGFYRLVAVRDEFKNSVLDVGTDGFGLPWKSEISVKSDVPEIVDLLVGPTKDTLGPTMYDARSLFSRVVETAFSEDIDTTSVRPEAFRAADSASGDFIPIQYAFFGKNAKTIRLILGKESENSRKIRLSPVMDSAYTLRDMAGNKLRDTLTSRYVTMSSKPDDAQVQIIRSTLRDSSTNVEVSPIFEVKFSGAADIDKAIASLVDISARKSIAVEKRNIQGTVLQITPDEKLEQNHWYELQIKFDNIVGWNGLPMHDTTVILHFQTIDLRQTGKITGILKDSSHNLNQDSDRKIIGYNISLVSEDGKRCYSQTLYNVGVFGFDAIPEGKYFIEVYAIENFPQQKKVDYYYGSAYPYHPSWRFYRHNLPIISRPRWTTEDVIINISE
ncbi:Ig-like domain-containing protein [Ignavibacteria bacterium]|nr:Ig-like domain-containing protein [Bacteroidota bacterium]MCZ2102409.1 Ig-like domain-containing protein [Chitinophagales bacterium]